MERWFAIFTKMEKKQDANLCPLLRRDHVGDLLSSVSEKDKRGFYEAMDWYDPFNPYHFVRDPSLESAAKAALLPTMYLGTGYAVTAYLSPGGLSYSPVINTLHRFDQLGRTIRYGMRVIIPTMVRSLPAAAAVYGLYSAMSYYNDFIQGLDWMPDVYQV